MEEPEDTRYDPSDYRSQIQSVDIEQQVKSDFLYYNSGYAFRPLTFLQTIFGVSRTLGSETFFKKLCCVSAMVVLLLSAAVVLYERMLSVYPPRTMQIVVTDVLSLLALVLTNMCNIFVSAFHSKSKYLRYFKNNEKILKFLKYSPERYKNGRQIVLNLLGIVFFSLFLVCSYDFYARVMYYDIHFASLYLINYLFMAMNSLVSLQFVCSLILHRNAFLMINVKIQAYYDMKHGIIENKIAAAYYDRSMIQNLLFQLNKFAEDALLSAKARTCKIADLMQAYVINCDQSKLSNMFFTEQNLLMVFNSLMSLVRSLYYVTSSSMKTGRQHPSRIMATCLIALFDTMVLIGITASCEAVHAEARRTSVILDTILSKRPPEDTNELKLWATLASRRCPRFSACNCFEINFSLLYNMAATVVTYLIVLTQLAQAGIGSGNRNLVVEWS